jgi:hypothetical protein
MTIRLLEAIARTELRSEIHEARLLVLLRGLRATESKPLDGITKLAKLDFLLRYPVALERALKHVGRDPSGALVQPAERDSIETKMIRFRYGPWDPRYRRWLAVLAGRGLVRLTPHGRTVQASLRPQGEVVAATLGALREYADLAARAKLINTAFGATGGTALATLIYRVFPELSSMEWGEEISI